MDAVDDRVWVPICLGLFLLPTILLIWFFRRACKSENVKTIDVHSARDQREHLLTYLFAMLIPLFDANLGGIRDTVAVALALAFVMFLFWHMRLHYMNLIFAICGYHIYTVEARSGTAVRDRSPSRLINFVVISRRHDLREGAPLTGYRLGGNVLVDKDDD